MNLNDIINSLQHIKEQHGGGIEVAFFDDNEGEYHHDLKINVSTQEDREDDDEAARVEITI